MFCSTVCLFEMLHEVVREALRVNEISSSPVVVDIYHVKVVFELFQKLVRHGAVDVIWRPTFYEICIVDNPDNDLKA